MDIFSSFQEYLFYFQKACLAFTKPKNAVTFVVFEVIMVGSFKIKKFSFLCGKHGIHLNFLAPRTLQQNEVVERKNRSLEELARNILSESSLPKYFVG